MSVHPDVLSDRPDPDPRGDVLSDVLAAVRMENAFYGGAHLTPPWGFSNRVQDGGAMFHWLKRGGAWLEVEGEAGLALGEGDVVLLASGRKHTLRDAPGSSLSPFREVMTGSREACATMGASEGAVVLSGCFHFHGSSASPLLRSLPGVMRIASADLPWLHATLQQIHEEESVGGGRPGSAAILRRLSDILFVQLVRAHLLASPTRGGWLRAVTDPHIGIALSALHARPEAPWTVASLAREAGLSRSVFAERFASLAGETPMQYLTRWRMEKATALLRERGEALAAIALRVGYESEASFGKAFKRWFDMAPGEFRRAGTAGSAGWNSPGRVLWAEANSWRAGTPSV
jgi:AraC-like DNA-binding protein